ncbi:hypothetical protein [Photobacterium leiognathi]|nr:hypothetical protein [Photobacterium leiognathi]
MTTFDYVDINQFPAKSSFIFGTTITPKQIKPTKTTAYEKLNIDHKKG